MNTLQPTLFHRRTWIPIRSDISVLVEYWLNALIEFINRLSLPNRHQSNKSYWNDSLFMNALCSCSYNIKFIMKNYLCQLRNNKENYVQ